MTTRIKNGKGRRGAVALEYILIASLVAIALMGAFVYFRRTLDQGMTDMTNTAGKGMHASTTLAKDELDQKRDAYSASGGDREGGK